MPYVSIEYLMTRTVLLGGNVRGLYWTKPDTTNVEEQRLEASTRTFIYRDMS